MADVTVYGNDFQVLPRKFKDMGDGTYAEVVSGGAGGTDPTKVPLSFTMAGTAAPMEFLYRPVSFNAVIDSKWLVGYNALHSIPGEPHYVTGTEGKFFDGTHTYNEWYIEQYWPGGDTQQDGTTPIAGGTTLNATATLPQATITVVDTSLFPTSGTFIIQGLWTGEQGQAITYTGKTGTTFTGCTGGTGTFLTGVKVSHFYNRPLYIYSLRDSAASYANVIKFDLGVSGNPLSLLTVSAGNTNVFFVNSTTYAIGAGILFTVAGIPPLYLPIVHPETSAWQPLIGPLQSLTLTANSLYYCTVKIPVSCSITGIQTRNDSPVSGNVLVTLYDAFTNQKGISASTAQAGTFNVQLVPFTSPVAATPGVYVIGFQIDNITGKLVTNTAMCPSNVAAQGGFAAPGTLTAPTIAQRATNIPVMATY